MFPTTVARTLHDFSRLENPAGLVISPVEKLYALWYTAAKVMREFEARLVDDWKWPKFNR